jgi:two-component system, cell cycle response regulator
MPARVLVVDDVEANAKLLEAKLSSEYFDVLLAYNGRDALEIADNELPDVILLEVMMPRMDGFEICRRLKANPRTADIPVAMLTALPDVDTRLRALEVGADDFLTKPVNDIILFARVRSLARLKRMMEEWRLREGIGGRFAGRDTALTDSGPARIILMEEDQFAGARIAEILRPIAQLVICQTCAEVQAQLDGDTELVIVSLSTASGDPLCLVTQCRASEIFRQLPILLIAEESDLHHLAKGLDLGANDYLISPVNRDELLARTGTQIRRKRLQDRLQENYQRSLSLALTDDLTGLYNRRYLLAHLDELIGRVNHDQISAAILLFDIDHFKQINGSYGHAAGDEVLRELASRATNSVRSVDLVARLGGEEFVVVMPETDIVIATAVAERLRSAVAREPFVIGADGIKVAVTVSIGVTAAAEGGDSREGLLKRADDALYSAKNAGRNRVVVIQPPPGRRSPPGRGSPPGQGSPPAPAPTAPYPVRPKPRSGGAAAPVEVTEESPPDAVARRTVSAGKRRDLSEQRRLASRRQG